MATKALNKKAVGTQMMGALKMAGGVIAGNLAGGMVNKMLKIDSTSKLPKKLIAPALLAVGGAIVAIRAKDANAKAVATGVSAAGVMLAAKVFMPNAGLAGELGFLTTTSTASNPDSWRYQDGDSINGLNFPALGMGNIDVPETTGGYYADAPAYLGAGGDDDSYMGGYDDDNMNGTDDEYAIAGTDDDNGVLL